jgi:hypothetical protein
LFFDSSKDKTRERVPTAEDFKNAAIQRAVLKESLQHPLTIFPFVVSFVSLLYMSIINLDTAAFAACCTGSAIGIGSMIFNYFFRGEKYAREYIQNLRIIRERTKSMEISSLLYQCRESKFQEGTQAAIELEAAYLKIHDYLEKRVPRNDLNAQHFLILSEDAYEKGRNILRRALNTFNALKAVDENKLEKEISLWKSELEKLKQEVKGEAENSQAQVKALTIKIASHEKRLVLYNERKSEFCQLLAECERIEGALESAYLQVIDLIEKDPDNLFKGDMTVELERAVDAAHRVEKNLQAIDKDREYLEIGKNVKQRT